MLRMLFTTLILLLLSATGLAAEKYSEVRLKESVTMEGSRLTVRDVVDPEGTDLDFVEKYGAVKFDDLREESESVDHTTLIATLIKAGADIDSLRFKDNTSVSLERGEKLNLTQTQNDAVIGAVITLYGLARGDVKIDEARIIPKLPQSTEEGFKFDRLVPEDFTFLDRAKMAAVVQDLDGNKTTHRLYLKLSVEATVVSAVEDIEAGTLISDTQYASGRTRLTSLKGTLASLDSIKGKSIKAVESIKKGEILASDKIRESLQIKKGSPVTLSYVTPYLNIRTQGTLLEPSEIGNVVQAENMESKRSVKGRLVAKDLVEVFYAE